MRFSHSVCPLLFLSLSSFIAIAQEPVTDTSSKKMDEIVITAFEQIRRVSGDASVKVIQLQNDDRSNKTSLVNSFNTQAGVRMEERSPGSYRINIRGSSLRSPFGVRNVKVYYNDIPITDPGGNTYFNQFAFNNFTSLDIIKGPVSSMYGAGTGGLVLARSLEFFKPIISVEYLTGSYNLQNIFTTVYFGEKDHQNKITYAHNQNDGYREHSSMNRDNFSWVNKNKKEGKYDLTTTFLYTHMKYETPGALTLAEYMNNPKDARPATGILPSASTAAAAIYQDNIMAGISSRYYLAPSFINATVVYSAFALINNPTFRFYEHRTEPYVGGRSSFIWTKKSTQTVVRLVAGTEIQDGFFNTTTSRNKSGSRDSLLTDDDIRYNVYSIFLQGDFTIMEKWFLEAGISSGSSNVTITRVNKSPPVNQQKKYRNEFSPRLSITRKFQDLSFAATLSRGYSPPAIAELLPSNNILNTNLEAEHGTNYELKVTYNLLHKDLKLTLESYYFQLKDALVHRRDASNADYFVNAGNVEEKGIEFSADYGKSFSSGCLEYITGTFSYTNNHFRYGNIQKDTSILSGKYLPGIPSHYLSMILDVYGRKKWYTNFSGYYASKIYLNDANSASTDAYLLIGCRVGYKPATSKKTRLHVYAGIDNLLDKSYSLGNDINDVTGRFYNAAPKRNYYLGVGFSFEKMK